MGARRFHRRLVCHPPSDRGPPSATSSKEVLRHRTPSGRDSSIRRGPQAPLVTVFACICSESALDPRSLPHGCSVALRRIRVRGRFLADLGASSAVSGRKENAWEISTAVVTCNSRCAIAETGKRREMVRVPRIGAEGLARPGRAGALRLNEEVL